MTMSLVEGKTCWQVRRADKASVIVDAAAFFRHARNAMTKAERSIFMIGWDFDTRIDLDPDGPDDDAPKRLGSFLNWLVKRRGDLDIRILKWDIGLINSITRGETPFYLLRWMFSKKITLKLDGAHPPMSAHHMKLLVIDDRVAFCGGIDMTVGRWDTREHLDKDKRRRSPLGFGQGPWHDATTCISGEAASALGDLARMRWKRATKERLEAPRAVSDPWPDELDADFRDIDIGIARTLPAYDEEAQVCEIETAKIAIIQAARKSLYIESQYFASRRIAEAIAARLKEPGGPEILVINPQGADGWLEAKAMDSARIRLMKMVGEADRFGRFRILYPVNEAGHPIYVHAKIMIADDRILKLGSANLNNRSMGYDTECDVIIEASDDRPDISERIAAHRTSLLAEHLGRDPAEVDRAIEGTGSLLKAMENLNRSEGRGLRPVEMRELTADEELIAESDVADPERPSGAMHGMALRLRRQPYRHA